MRLCVNNNGKLMKKELSNTNPHNSPKDAIQLIQSGFVMIIGLLVAVIGLIVLLNNGSPIWGYGLIITGAILACFLPLRLIILNAKTR